MGQKVSRPTGRDTLRPCSECQDICVGQSDEVVGSSAGGIQKQLLLDEAIFLKWKRMLSAAFHRAAALGYQQWWDPFPVAVLEDSVLRGKSISYQSSEVLCSCTFALSWEDPMFWGERPIRSWLPRSPLCQSRYRSPGLRGGDAHLGGHHSRQPKSSLVRLDTPASNARLRAYYETLGFLFQGESDVALSGPTGEPEIYALRSTNEELGPIDEMICGSAPPSRRSGQKWVRRVDLLHPRTVICKAVALPSTGSG